MDEKGVLRWILSGFITIMLDLGPLSELNSALQFEIMKNISLIPPESILYLPLGKLFYLSFLVIEIIGLYILLMELNIFDKLKIED
jgi:hypothetical protein